MRVAFPLFLRFDKQGSRLVLACLLGAIAALGFEPFGLPFLLALAFPILYSLLQRAQGARQAFWTGFGFAMGFLTVCLHWIAGALFVDLQTFWWALPLAVFGLPAFFSLYYGLAAALAARLFDLQKPSGVFVLALFWFLAELARAHLFTGFPWDLVGYVWADTLSVLQGASLVGVEGLTLFTLFLSFLPALFLTTLPRLFAGFFCFLGGLSFLTLAAWGQARLDANPPTFEADITLRLVQPQLPQAWKWQPERRLSNLQTLLRLSGAAQGQPSATHIVWPETATAYYLAEAHETRARIAQDLPRGSRLLTGVVRRAVGADSGVMRFHNALIALNDLGTIEAGYDKAHLVPFGEYLPFRAFLPQGLRSVTGADFTAGEGARTLRVSGLPPFSPLICYEAIFSGSVVDREDPPRFLLNLTNDAWYEGTIGPRQHFLIARVRAVEEGLPLVRVANGGVTGVVDAYGRTSALLSEEREGALNVALPQPASKMTVFSQKGRKFPRVLALSALIFIVVRKIQRKFQHF